MGLKLARWVFFCKDIKYAWSGFFPLCKPSLSFSFETEWFLVLGILLATSVCVGSFVRQIAAGL